MLKNELLARAMSYSLGSLPWWMATVGTITVLGCAPMSYRAERQTNQALCYLMNNGPKELMVPATLELGRRGYNCQPQDFAMGYQDVAQARAIDAQMTEQYLRMILPPPPPQVVHTPPPPPVTCYTTYNSIGKQYQTVCR